jgi:cytoskeletal protein CcmA (bactofilin family)
MKHLYSFFLLVIISLFVAAPAEAKIIAQEKGLVSVGADEVINDDLYIGAESVDIAGTVNGDIYIGAGTVNFRGKVSGDLVVGTGTLNVTKGVIGDSLIVGAGTVIIDDQSRIGGSLLAGTGTLDNRAPVGRNFMAGAGTINSNSSVGGEARLAGERLALGPKTRINGDLTYATEREISQDKGAIIKGKITRHQTPEFKPVDKRQMAKAWVTAKLGLEGLSFLGAFLVGLVMLWLLPKFTLDITGKIQDKFLASLGWGLVVLMVAPMALFLLAITGIGLPLAGIFTLLLFVDLYLAKVFASLALGQGLKKYFGWNLKLPVVFFIGLAVYYLLRLIPVIGFFVRIVGLLAGIGGVWLYKKQLLAKR